MLVAGLHYGYLTADSPPWQLMSGRLSAAALLLLLGMVMAAAMASDSVVVDARGTCVPKHLVYEGDLECSNITPDGRLHCYLMFRALDYAPFFAYGFGLLVHFTLSQMPDTGFTGSSSEHHSLCWSLDSIKVSKETDTLAMEWNRVRPHLNFFGIYLLHPIKEFRITADYPPVVPAVTTQVNASCWDHSRSPHCIVSAHVSKNVLLPNTSPGYTAYNESYWDDVRQMHLKKLNAENITLHLEVEKGSFLDSVHYLQPLLRDTPFESLHLINANLTELQMGEQHKMKDIILMGSTLTTNDAERFISSMPHVEHLSLAHNNLTTIPQGISRIKNLTVLDLSHNAINFSYSTTVISSMHKLKVLNVAANPIGSLSAFMNQLNSKLQLLLLNISKCSLSEMEPIGERSTLRDQNELQVLDLSYNALSNIPHDIFQEMNNLKALHISHNRLNKWLRLHLPHNGIDILDLSYNELESPENIVESGKAVYVILKGNKIHSWKNSDIFLIPDSANSTWLTKIDISDCKINAVNEEMQMSLQYIQVVDLGGNPIDCSDCSIPLFKLWLQSRNESQCCPKLLNHGKQTDFTCAHPENLSKKSIFLAEDNYLCKKDYSVAISVPLATVFALAVFTGAALYLYRFEITYILHLVKIRKLRMANAAMMKNFQYDAFVSYSGKDRNWVTKKLVPQLENGPEKYKLCLHERDFILGSIISRNIASFMQESKNTIIILTSNFVGSQWCQWELEMANHKVFADDREFLIFIELERLERHKLPRHLRYLMDTRTYLEWPTPEEISSETESNLWKRLRVSLGPSIAQIRAGHRLQGELHLP